jgi:hypothetical protein
MLKKMTLVTLMILTIQVFGMETYETQTSPTSQDQINHIKAEMLVLKRAFNSERIRIKIAQKASLTAYQTFTPIFDKILASDNFTTKLNEVVTSQFDSIVNNNMTFNSVKTEFNISDFFPNMTITEFGKKLFSAMANKACYLELGKRLAQRIQELQMIVTSMPVES